MRCRGLKPGSLTAKGTVVGLYPVRGDPMQHPVVVPRDLGVSLGRTIGRCRALGQAGWLMCPPALMPKIPEVDEVVLIHATNRSYRQWVDDAIDRAMKRAAAARHEMEVKP